MEVRIMDWLTTEDQKAAWEAVRKINAAWLEGHFDGLDELFHDRVVVVGPDGTRYAEGKPAVIESYRDFGRRATVSDYRESDGRVDVFEATAVVSYRYDITYAIDGQSSQETGRDIMVLGRHDGRWLAVWRMVTAQAS
jgi:ketosteroid isomerase-like protein